LEPLVVAFYQVDYVKNAKGKIQTSMLNASCFYLFVAMVLLVIVKGTTPMILSALWPLPITK
jgi:hypothetical protein